MARCFVIVFVAMPLLCFGLPQKNNGLKLTTLSENIVAGKYIDRMTGMGIRFLTKSDGALYIGTLDNRAIINIGTAITTTRTRVTGRIIDVEGASFLQDITDDSEDKSYYLYPNEVNRIRSATNEEEQKRIFQEVLKEIDKKDKQFHQNAVRDSISTLLNDSHFQIILDAVHTIGEKEGLTGKDYPALLPMYIMAAKLEQLANNPSLQEETEQNQNNVKKVRDKRCYHLCPPCPDNNCLGMCGQGCSCWSWVCGDCCWHLGCYWHDTWCAENGYWSFSCIFGALIAPLYC